MAAVSLLVAGESPTLCAATYTWDANGGTTGPQDGAGTWNTTLQNWWDGAQNIAWPNPNTVDIARFGAGSGAAGTVTVGAVQANGLTFDSAGSGGYTLSSGTITLGGSSPTITTSVNATIQSSLAGSGFTKSGASQLTLSGALANTFTGTTTVSQGALSLAKSAGVAAISGDLVVNSGNVITSNATNQFSATSNVSVTGNATINSGDVNSVAQTVNNVTHTSTALSNLTSWTISGTLAMSSGTISLGNVNTSMTIGTGSMTGGQLFIWGFGNTSTNSVNIGSGGLSMANASIRLGGTSNGIPSSGTPTLSLAGNYTGSGTNSIFRGSGNATARVDLGSATRTFTISGGTTTIDTGVSVIGTGGLTKAGAGTLALSASNSYSGGTQVNAGVIALGNAGALGSTGTISFGGGTLQFSASNTIDYSSRFSTAAGQAYGLDTNGQNITLAGALTSPGGSLTKSGAGRLTLNGANTFSGNTVISGGTLALGSAASLASTFIKAGNAAGDGGVLDVTALGSGLSVAGGQKLGGYGTVLGNVAIAGGAIVAPGGSIGALTESGTMTWGGGGRYLFEITNANGDGSYAGSRWDLLTVTNLLITATSSNPFIVDVQSLTNAGDGAAGLLSAGNWDPDTSYQWKFLVATNTTFSDANFSTNWFTVNSGSFLNATSGLFSVARGGAGGLGGSTTSNELYVVYAAVPEPAALSLAGIGAGLAGWLLWKRRHRRGSR